MPAFLCSAQMDTKDAQKPFSCIIVRFLEFPRLFAQLDATDAPAAKKLTAKLASPREVDQDGSQIWAT